jgi:hypothetical protein
MGMARKISHFLAALVSNASDFKRGWNQDAPLPSAANGLQVCGLYALECMSPSPTAASKGEKIEGKAAFWLREGRFLKDLQNH